MSGKKKKRTSSDAETDVPLKKSKKSPKFDWTGANKLCFELLAQQYGLNYRKVFSVMDKYQVKVTLPYVPNLTFFLPCSFIRNGVFFTL